jgi:catechol 2,3-dioxygenase-like lactoylglutathione lyase family enzyme
VTELTCVILALDIKPKARSLYYHTERRLHEVSMTLDYDNPGAQVLRPAFLAHVVLRTTDNESFRAMVDFWVDFLNAEVTYQNEVLSFLTYDEEHHRIAIGIFPGTTRRVGKPAGLAHIAFTYSTMQELAMSYRQRRVLGMKPFWSVNHGPTTSLYYHDPDGNEIEIQVDNFNTTEEATAFFASAEFEENPIGVDFDPEDLVTRLQQGENDASIKKRPCIGARKGIPGW